MTAHKGNITNAKKTNKHEATFPRDMWPLSTHSSNRRNFTFCPFASQMIMWELVLCVSVVYLIHTHSVIWQHQQHFKNCATFCNILVNSMRNRLLKHNHMWFSNWAVAFHL